MPRHPLNKEAGTQVICTTSIENYDLIAARAKREHRTVSRMLSLILDDYLVLRGEKPASAE
jgi:hypothetical protein